MNNFAIYVVGILLTVGALAYGAFLLGVDMKWIAIGAVALIGAGIVSGVTATRQKDASAEA